MTTWNAAPMPELGLELVRDVDRERFRSRLPRWDPRLWGDAQFSKNTRPGNRLLKLGLAWGRERVKARKLQQENVTPTGDVAPVSCFTGKEEDVEVGLIYFGKRYLSPYLGRWISADPLAVHAPGEADLNLYAYVNGRVLKNTDPLGLAPTAEQAFVMKGMDEVGVAMKNPGLSKQMKELVLKVNVEWMDLGGDTMRTDRKYAWFGMRLGLDRKLVPGRSMFDIGAFAMHEGVHIRDDQVSFGGGDAQYTEGRAYAAQTFLNVRGGGAVSEQNRLWRIAITSGGTGAGAGDGFRKEFAITYSVLDQLQNVAEGKSSALSAFALQGGGTLTDSKAKGMIADYLTKRREDWDTDLIRAEATVKTNMGSLAASNLKIYGALVGDGGPRPKDQQGVKAETIEKEGQATLDETK